MRLTRRRIAPMIATGADERQRPFGLRFLLMKEPELLRTVERRLVEAVFAANDIRRRGWAQRAGARAPLCSVGRDVSGRK